MDISRSSLSVGISTGLLHYFPKSRAILVLNLGEEKKCQNPFPAIWRLKKIKKVLWPLSPSGGGKASKRKEPFIFAASLKELAQKKTNKKGSFIKKHFQKNR